MNDKLCQLRAERDELESRLLALEHAIEAQRPPQWWEGSPAVTELVQRAAELLQRLGTVNDQLATMNIGPTSDPV